MGAGAPGTIRRTVELPDGLRVTLTDDPRAVDREALWGFLSTEAYWGRWRTRAQVEDQVDSAWRVVSAHADGRMVGFARAISDGVGTAYLADLYVDAHVRGHGLGRALVEEMVDRGPGARLRWMLHTRDAHGLYRAYGFHAPDETYLERAPRGAAGAGDDSD